MARNPVGILVRSDGLRHLQPTAVDLHQKPPINLREVENLLDGEARAQGVANEEHAFGFGHTQT